jgi:uncharacterized protein
VRRPQDLFDREAEWSDLVDFAGRDGPGTRLAIVRGRRRQGKSYLLRRLARAAAGFYYQAVEEEPHQALAGFGQSLGEHLQVPGGQLRLDSWDAALRAVGDLPAGDGPAVVVLDEFPYLLHHSPELPSLLQRFIDRTRDDRRALRIIVCGSALSVMADLLAGAQALRGRVSTDVVVQTFDYRRAAAFWGMADSSTAFLVHAVVGGTPGYRDVLPAAPPRQPRDLDAWLAAGPLNPASALFREDDYLLAEDRPLSSRAIYHAVLSAIAGGHTSQASIAQALGREQRAVQHPLRTLEEAGFIVAADDAFRSRRPLYRIADPIVRFHHVVTRRDLARFEDRRTREAWSDARPRFRAQVLGPHFEDLAREFTLRFASAATAGGQVASVSAAVVNDPGRRIQHQIDVVAFGREPSGSTRVVAIGEAKYTTARRTVADVRRLENLRRLLADRNAAARGVKLLLFSAAGFDSRLEALAASRADVELIDLGRMYAGG